MSSVPAMSRQRRIAFAKRRPVMRAIVDAPRAQETDYSRSGRFLSGKHRLGFHLDAPPGIEQLLDDDHGGSRSNVAEDLAVSSADLLPIPGVGEVYAGADDVLEAGAGVEERGLDELEAGAGLFGSRETVRADGAGAGDVDNVADAHGARETDDGFVGRCTGDVRAGHGVDVNQQCRGSLWR